MAYALVQYCNGQLDTDGHWDGLLLMRRRSHDSQRGS